MIDVQLYIKKNTAVESGSVSANNSSPFTTITNSSKSYTTDQYKGFYVKIISGTGVGSVSWILSNTSTVLTLETGIQVEVGSIYRIYKSDYQKLDLFKAEKISVTSQIANVNDIGKVFTDYSQSFTIPASARNNKILSHWYESTVDDGFDHRVRYDGFIEINTQRFKDGNFQLEKASKKNGFIESYTLTFYGNLTQIKDILQDDKLSTLDFTPYNHPWDYTNIITRIVSSPATWKIKYPLIGSKRKFYYNDASYPTEDVTTNAGAIKWNELFPAIPISEIFLLIKEKYGIEFTGTFLDEDQYKKLHLYLKPSTELNFDSQPVRADFNATGTLAFPQLNLATDVLTLNFNAGNNLRFVYIDFQITPASGYTTIPYTVRVFKNNLLFQTFTNQVGLQLFQIEDLQASENLGTINNYYFEVSATSSFQFIPTLFVIIQFMSGATNSYQGTRTSVQTISANMQLKNYMPDMTISDFFTGIVKAFNLMIVPKGDNVFDLSHLESYYNAGKITDISKFVYANEMEIEKPKLFKSINFTYQKSPNILNTFYKGYYGTEYGDLIYNPISSNESASYDIKLPFENVLFERTSGTQFETATIIDKDLKPYIPKPMLIYCNGINTTALSGGDRIIIQTPIGYSPITYYNRFSNEYNSLPNDVTNSGLMTMNFGNEQSPWYNVLAPRGLYYRHYKNYIDNLYNIKSRIVKVKALLPPSLMTSNVLKGTKKSGIALNDRLVIRNKRYIINSFTTDLTTGEANFELITDYRGPDAYRSIGYRFSNYYNLEFINEATDFETIIYLNDYDSFEIKGALDFLSYTATSSPQYGDLLLSVTMPANTTGFDRYDEIGIEYTRDGVMVLTEAITITQLA